MNKTRFWNVQISKLCKPFSYKYLNFRVTGFHIVETKGELASFEEAPVLVCAPHSTFFDGFAVFWSGLPYIVSRNENRQLPLIGKCIELGMISNKNVHFLKRMELKK